MPDLSTKRRKRFASWLQIERESHGLTLREFGAKVECSASWLGRLENGLEDPSRKLLMKFAEIFSVDEDIVLARGGLIPLDLLDLLQRKPSIIRHILVNYGLKRSNPVPATYRKDRDRIRQREKVDGGEA